jgi:hypothetical protein
MRPDTTRVWNLLDDIRSVNTVDGVGPADGQPVVTLPQYLRALGYTTRGFGKVFHSKRPPNNDFLFSFSDFSTTLSTTVCSPVCSTLREGEAQEHKGDNHGNKLLQVGDVSASIRSGSASASSNGRSSSSGGGGSSRSSTQLSGLADEWEQHKIDQCLLCPSDDPESAFEDYDAVSHAVASLQTHVQTHGVAAPFFFVLGICKPHTPFRYPTKFAQAFPVQEVVHLPLPYTNSFPAQAGGLEWVESHEIMGQIHLNKSSIAVDNTTAWKIRAGYYHASAFADEVRRVNAHCVRRGNVHTHVFAGLVSLVG